MHSDHDSTPGIRASPLGSASDTRLHGRWLFVARLSLVAVSLFNLLLYVIGTPVYFAHFHSLCTDNLDDCLTPDRLQSLHVLGISITTYAVYMVALNLLFALVYFAAAALIFWRKSDDWMACLAAFSLVAFGASFTYIPETLALVHPAWWLPVTLVSENVLGFPSLIVFLLLFPTGRFVPRWTRWVAVAYAALSMPAAFFPGSLFGFWPRPLFSLLLPVVLGLLVFAQVYRYRRVSTPVARQQTKWVVLGTAVALLGFLLLILLAAFFPVEHWVLFPTVIVLTSIYLLLLLIPFSFAVALLRYRLWDVDVLINKTLVYGLLTGILALIYVSLILALQSLTHALTGQLGDNPLLIVGSTLVIAALFTPLRRRIQTLIDRRFYRRKYDAARTLAAFNETLRHEVDLDQLSEELVKVVQDTMQPSHVSFWLCKNEQRGKPNTDE